MHAGRAVYLAEAVRTPVGRRGGQLSEAHPADLAGHVLRELVDRCAIDPGVVGDVILGCVNQIGAQTSNIARTAWLSAGLPEHVPGVTVDRRCGSSQQAIDFAAQAVAAGVHDVAIAGGVEVMSLVPIGSPASVGGEAGFRTPFDGDGWQARYGDEPVSQFHGAELVAQRWGIARAEMEEFALSSHQRAVAAQGEGRFDRELVPFGAAREDEGPRERTSLEKMASLSPLTRGGMITAAVASQISDAASVVLVASEDALETYGLKPRARIRASSVVGTDPITMLTGPIPATKDVLDRAGLVVGDIDLFEVNEAFAPVVLAWARDTGAPLEQTNVNGGAIALGHPLGATGARLMTTLLHELERRGGRYGLQVICEGGGTANAMVIERVRD